MSKGRVVLTAEEISRSIERISLQIVEKNASKNDLVIVGIHTCGVFLAERICEKIKEISKVNVLSGSLDITLYRDDWTRISQSPEVKKTDIPFSIDETNLVLVDDVIYSGRTIRAAMDALIDFGRPDSIQLAVLVDRGGRELPIQPDYTGLEIEVKFNEKIKLIMTEDGDKDEVIIER